MNEFQKIVKYGAMVFAILLAVGIITAIAGAAYGIISVISGDVFSDGEGKDLAETFTGVESLDIENSSGQLKIVIGDEFKVEAKNVSDRFTAKVNGSGKLIVADKDNRFGFLWFDFGGFHNTNSVITIYLPADFVAREAKLNTGAGNITIEGLKADNLSISAGAGNINGTNMAADKVEIDGGVGNIKLTEVYFKDTDIDCGVGDLDIKGILLGDTELDCGVGSVDLELEGQVEDYDLDIDSGIGTVRLNGNKISGSHKKDNNAENKLRIDGGVGGVDIQIK